MSTTTSLPKVYAVFAEDADAEAYAEKLRKTMTEVLWPEDEPVAAFCGVRVMPLSVN
jgi:hypothetical protein